MAITEARRKFAEVVSGILLAEPVHWKSARVILDEWPVDSVPKPSVEVLSSYLRRKGGALQIHTDAVLSTTPEDEQDVPLEGKEG